MRLGALPGCRRGCDDLHAEAFAEGVGVRCDVAQVAVDQQPGVVELHAFFAPQVEHGEIAAAVEDVLIGVPEQLVAMADEGAQRFAVGLAGEVDHDVLEVLAQGAEQHVQLGGTGEFQRFIVACVGKDPQPVFVTGEGAVDQRRVQASYMPQRVAEMIRALQSKQRQAVAAGQTEVQQQGLLAALLHHVRHVVGEQRAVGIALHAVQHGQAPQMRVRRYRRQTFAQAPYQSGDFTGTRAIGDEVPCPGAHGVEHELVVHAVAQRDDRQHRLGFQRAFDQRALRHHIFAVQADEHQAGERHIDQRQQFVEAAAAGADDLAQWGEGALQPFEVGAVARDREEGLTQVLAHCDNPLRLSKLPFSRKYMR